MDIEQDEGFGTQITIINSPMTDDLYVIEDMGNPSNTKGFKNPTNEMSILYMMKSLASPTFTVKKSRIMHTWGFA